MAHRLKNGSWRAQKKIHNILVLDKSFKTKKEALAAEAQALVQFAGLNKSQTVRKMRSAELTFWLAYDPYRSDAVKQKADSTIKADDSRANVLRELIPRDLKLSDYSTTDWKQFLEKLRVSANLSAATLSNYKALISAVYNYARNNMNYDGSNPMHGLKIPKISPKPSATSTFKDDHERLSINKSKYIPTEVFDEFIEKCKALENGYESRSGRKYPGISPKLKWFLLVMRAVAMRAGEAQSLTYSAVNRLSQGESIYLKDTKNTTEREVKPVAKLREVCKQIVSARTEVDEDEHLVFAEHGRPFDYISMLRTVSYHGFGLPKSQLVFRAHDIRHTTITNLVKAGVPREIVKATAGHLSDQAHGKYVHIVDALTTNDPLEGVDY